MRISDWSSDVCSSDLNGDHARVEGGVVGDVGGVCVHVRSRACWSGFSRELLPRLLPLRRQGEVGRGWCRFAAMPTAPLPNPPLPSQGRGRKLAAEAAPKWPSVAALFVVQTLVARLALQIGRASCRERVCQYVAISLVDLNSKKKK